MKFDLRHGLHVLPQRHKDTHSVPVIYIRFFGVQRRFDAVVS
jgi:hypothetical protein